MGSGLEFEAVQPCNNTSNMEDFWQSDSSVWQQTCLCKTSIYFGKYSKVAGGYRTNFQLTHAVVLNEQRFFLFCGTNKVINMFNPGKYWSSLWPHAVICNQLLCEPPAPPSAQHPDRRSCERPSAPPRCVVFPCLLKEIRKGQSRQLKHISLFSIWLCFSGCVTASVCFVPSLLRLLSLYIGQQLSHTLVWIIKKAPILYSYTPTRRAETNDTVPATRFMSTEPPVHKPFRASEFFYLAFSGLESLNVEALKSVSSLQQICQEERRIMQKKGEVLN